MNWAEHNLTQVGDIVSVTAWQKFDWLKQGFSLRSAGNIDYRFGDVTENRKALTSALGFELSQWTGMQQVHGSHIELVDGTNAGKGSNDFESGFAETDGLVTDSTNTLLAVVVADCVPLLFMDPIARRIAVAHAGRRGTNAGIAKIAFNYVVKCGSRAEDIQVVIGPSIGPCCYEIDRQTNEHFDLWGINEEQLRQAGAQTVIRTDVCTNDHNDLFFSHRADSNEARFAGLIGMS